MRMTRIRPRFWFALLGVTTAMAQDPAPFEETVAAVVRAWCVDCHAGAEPDGGLDLAPLLAGPDALPLPRLRRIRQRLRGGEMPPPGGERPERSVVRATLERLDHDIARRAAAAPVDPGRVTVRRLSRAEYRNTIRDLLGVDFDPRKSFPADDLGYGFDNIGAALSVSALHLEHYAAAAETIAAEAILCENPDDPPVSLFEAEHLEASANGVNQSGDAAAFYSRGMITARVRLPRDGVYLVRIMAFAQQAGPEVARMGLVIDDAGAQEIEVPETDAKPGVHELRLSLPGGDHRIGVTFVNDYYRPEDPDPAQRDRNLYVDQISVVGPVDRRDPSPAHRWIFAADPGRGTPIGRARPMMKVLAERAWRRPPTRVEVDRLAKLVGETAAGGASFEASVRLALEAVLVSPHFLFRMEPGGHRGPAGRIVDLDPWHLASRLSYLVWSSLPDAPLFAAARDGTLRDEEVLVREARRLLADARAAALAENFGGQWLELRNLADATPDPARFPAFTPTLRAAMRQETLRFFEAVLRERRPVRELLDADFTFVNGELARHYGIEGVEGEAWRRITLDDPRRGGVLGHASVQVITSNPTRTSPVKRGKWILENILDAPPPPPPPGADSLPEPGEAGSDGSLRSQLERHRAAEECASCHLRMDALGFALENYDPVGRWRTEADGFAVEAESALPDGTRLDGPVVLKRHLATDPGFVRCVARKLFIYAVGREPGPSDENALDVLVAGLPGADTTLEQLVVGVVRLDAFRRRTVTR